MIQRTFIIESIYSVNTGHFVIPSEEKEILRVFNLVGQQEADGLHGLFASVHVIPEEQVVGIRRKRAVFKQSEQVCVLAMNVTYKTTSRKRWLARPSRQVLLVKPGICTYRADKQHKGAIPKELNIGTLEMDTNKFINCIPTKCLHKLEWAIQST